MENDIFIVKARKCKRCGRLLTSEKAVKEGMGDTCRCKATKEELAKKPIDGQMNITDFLGE